LGKIKILHPQKHPIAYAAMVAGLKGIKRRFYGDHDVGAWPTVA